MDKKSGFKLGETAPFSGQYEKVGPRGGKGTEITSVKSERFPPSPIRGTTYKLVDRTRHKK